MDAYAKMLGNSVKPSQTRSDDAKAAWKSWRQSGDAQHLTREGVAEGSVNDYFKRRKDEEDRIAGTKAPAKRTPKQTDYEKKRKEQGVAEAQLAELKKSTVKSYADKKQAELDDVPPMPFKKPAMTKAEHERAAKGMMGALARLGGKKPTSEGAIEGQENSLDESSHGSINDDDWYEIDGDGKIVKQSGPQSYRPSFGVKVIKLANGNRVVRGMTGKTQGLFSGLEEGKTGPGLWANIHAKRERIKHGSGERMRKPGSKGSPTAKNFKDASVDEATDLKSIPEADDEKIADRYDPRDFDAMVDRLGKLAKEQDSRLGPVDLAKLAKLLHGREQTNESSLEEERMLAKELIKRAELFKRGKSRDLGEKPADRGIQKKSVNLEDLDANQKRVGQLGPTEPVKNNNIGKLVGANESIENIRRLAGL
jgi:hypothetical protein